MMIMSDLSQLFGTGAAAGFARDARYSATPPAPVADAEDPLGAAFAEGYAQGHVAASAEAELHTAEETSAREGLSLSLVRLDETLREQLHQRLNDCVAALCEAAISPLALDHEALATRISRAVAMLARADDDRVIRLHPDDLAFLSPQMSAEWIVEADPALERGALRVECVSGGVEDGPAQWRAAIAEAVRGC